MTLKKGKTKTSTSSSTTIPTWLEDASQEAVGKAKGIADRPYTPYDKPFVAPLSSDEQAGIDLQREQGSSYQPIFNKAEDAADSANTSWLNADQGAYMSPFADAALEPGARKLREQGTKNIRDAGSSAAMADAFGGSRATLLQTETAKNNTQAISDYYAEGFQKNYEDAYQKFNSDRENFRSMADEYRGLGKDTQDAIHTEVASLMENGALSRNLEQMGIGFDYKQFQEARDWDVSNLQPLLEVLGGVPHSSTSTGSGSDSGGGGGIGDILGLASTVVGLFGGKKAASKGIGGMIKKFGGKIFCAVAREVFGPENPEWVRFYYWKERHPIFRRAYNRWCDPVAAWMHDKPRVKALVRRWMRWVTRKR